jgi:hypothetical protein
MAQKARNPLAQGLGLAFQNLRDKMGGVSSSEIASSLGLAASHYRMIEAGSAILQPARAIKVVQTFEVIEFVPLCQVLVAIQILDSVKQSVDDMRTMADLIVEANPALSRVMSRLENVWDILGTSEASFVSRQILSEGIVKELEAFLTTEPVALSADQIDNFMTPTFENPISGQLYSKIGNILQGVAPFYLDIILQLVDNLKGITPRVTPEELAVWEAKHKSRISHIIGIVRKPEIIMDVDTFDYSFLWQENFSKMLIIHSEGPGNKKKTTHQMISDCLKKRYESERIKYTRELESFDKTLNGKLVIEHGRFKPDKIDNMLRFRDMEMNNLWVYILDNGYVVLFVDNADVGSEATNIYGTSLTYEETCQKLVTIKEMCDEIGFRL